MLIANENDQVSDFYSSFLGGDWGAAGAGHATNALWHDSPRNSGSATLAAIGRDRHVSANGAPPGLDLVFRPGHDLARRNSGKMHFRGS
jgi:hypothetical protein